MKISKLGVRSTALWLLMWAYLDAPRLFCCGLSTRSNALPKSLHQKALDDIKFPRTYVPVASAYELDPERPNQVYFLGQRYVVSYLNDQWVVMDDVCPHRNAPLHEGRVSPTTGLLECSYHGWSFNEEGSCQGIPQANPKVQEGAKTNPACHVKTYPTIVEKNIIFCWPWSEDPLSPLLHPNETSCPEHILSHLWDDPDTYTRDLPYSWENLVENIVDPSHVPHAHHGLQGTRHDALPINMTTPNVQPDGFRFEFDDRTMGMVRHGTGDFRAPYVVTYNGTFEGTTERTFNLTTILIPTRPGWSRIIIPTGGRQPSGENSERRRLSVFSILVRILPRFLLHQLSNRFLDSDLIFLHYQERESKPYFMPTEADRCIVALQRWLRKYTQVPGPLSPLQPDRRILFDRLLQHTEHCKFCRKAYERVPIWRRNTLRTLAVSVLLVKRFLLARISVVGCIIVLRHLQKIDNVLRYGNFQHFKNH